MEQHSSNTHSAATLDLPRTTAVKLARFYARRGWAVLALHTQRAGACSCAAGASCARAGAHPIDGLDVSDATVDPETIDRWWGTMPDANIGVATGRASGLAVVRFDIDLLAPAARAVLDPLLALDPWIVRLARTTVADAFVAAERDIPVPSEKIRPGLAVLGDGDFVVVPWSQLVAGRVGAEEEPSPALPLPPWPLGGLRDIVQTAAPDSARGAAVLPTRSVSLVARNTQLFGAELIIRVAADITPVPVPWLWKGFIAQRSITSLDGDPGTGKSTLLIDLVARITRGDCAPLSDQRMPAGGVLVIAGEDDVESVLRPRLDSAGAVVDRVLIATNVLPQGSREPHRLALPEDVDAIERACVERDVRMVVIDPVMDFIGPGVDASSDHSVRRGLASLRDLAQRRDLSIVLVRHIVKRGGGRAMHRGSGSIAFTGLARTVIQVDPLGGGSGVLSVVKSNAGPLPAPVAFDIVLAADTNGIEAGRVEWRAYVPDDAAAARPDSVARRARDFLLACLASGPLPSTDVLALAKQLNIGKRSLESAKKELGIVSQKKGGRWFWPLGGEGRNTAVPRDERALAVLDGEHDDASEPDELDGEHDDASEPDELDGEHDDTSEPDEDA